MNIQKNKITISGIKFFIKNKNKEIARAYLYILKNNLHKKPFAFIEDVFVQEDYRGKGLGTKILNKLIEEAKEIKCYKIIANARNERQNVHNFYKNLGFKDWGKEFRLDI